MRWGAALMMGLCWLAAPVWAEDAASIQKILAGGDMQLADARVLHLSGIHVFPEADDFLAPQLLNQSVILGESTIDRYGRLAATVTRRGHSETLQEELLRQGLAFVYPVLGSESALDTFLAAEHAAFVARRGGWATHPDSTADEAEKLYGHYGFVTGEVVTAERVKNKIYLNFGADWRTDYTVTIMAHDLRAFKKSGIDPLTWQGKKIRVRGWVKRDFGPMITVTDPHQITLM